MHSPSRVSLTPIVSEAEVGGSADAMQLEEDEGQTQLSLHVPKMEDPTKSPRKPRGKKSIKQALLFDVRPDEWFPPPHQYTQGQQVAMG